MIYNVIIIGSGPAGYTAALYTSRATLAPLVFTGEQFGGQLMMTTEIENFPGFPHGIAGPKLMMDMRAQAQRFGAKLVDADVTKVDFSQRPFRVWQGETEYQSKSVIIATGAEALRLHLPKENELYGHGISTCAVCDAAFYREKTVYVVGGGDSAMEDTLALTRFASKVFVVVRKDSFRASKIMQKRVLENPKVIVLWNTEVIELGGKERLTHLKLLNSKTNEERLVTADGLFYAIGHVPNTSLFDSKVKKDEKGYILTTINGLSNGKAVYETWRHGYPTMTSINGVFAAGDVVDFRFRQAITAAAYGTMAALDVERWLETQEY